MSSGARKIFWTFLLFLLCGLLFYVAHKKHNIGFEKLTFSSPTSYFEPAVFISFDTSSHSLEILVKNVGRNVIPIAADGLTVKGFPEGVFVRILDEHGRALTDYRTPYSRLSEMGSSIPKFTHLQPGQEIESRVSWSMDNVPTEVKNQVICVQFKVIVTGPTYTVNKETKPACMTNIRQ